MIKESKEKRGELGFQLNRLIIDNEIQRRKLLADSVKYLYRMFKEKLYKEVLGDDEAEWSGFLAQVEVYYKRSSVYNLLELFEFFTEKNGIDLEKVIDVPVSRLMDIKRIGKDLEKVRIYEWIDKARVLIPSDWKMEIREFQGLSVGEDCKHIEVPYLICKICGYKHRA